MKRFDRELTDITIKLREKEKLENILKKNHEALADKNKRLKELAAVMEKEGSDLKKLESLSLTGLFYTVLGSKEEQLEKERQEFLTAKLRYDEARKSIGDLEASISRLSKDMSFYEEIEEQYESIMKEKEAYILEHEDEASRKLIGLIEELAELESSRKELEEAVLAGNEVKGKLHQMIGSLESAGNWGTWDMLGGGFLATAVKHSRIDEAQDHAYGVQQLLRNFKNELEDVNTHVDLNVNVSSFEAFGDYFFDGLIFDWIVQARIDDSMNNAVRMKEDIENIMRELNRKLIEVDEKRLSVEKEKSCFIEEI